MPFNAAAFAESINVMIFRKNLATYALAEMIALKAVEAETDRFFKFIAQQVIKTGSQAGGGTLLPGLLALGVRWKPLTKAYAQSKGHEDFWVKSGKMRRSFNSRSGIKTFGKPEGTGSGRTPRRGGDLPNVGKLFGEPNPNSRRSAQLFSQQILDLKIRVFPKLSRSNFTGGPRGYKDAEDFVSRNTAYPRLYEALMNRRNAHRSLIPPTLDHFYKSRFPQAIKAALRAKGFKVEN